MTLIRVYRDEKGHLYEGEMALIKKGKWEKVLFLIASYLKRELIRDEKWHFLEGEMNSTKERGTYQFWIGALEVKRGTHR